MGSDVVDNYSSRLGTTYQQRGVGFAYFELAGRFVSSMAGAEQMVNSVLATEAGIPKAQRGWFADDRLASIHLREKVTKIVPIAERVLGSRHITTGFLRTTAFDLVNMRNHVAHGHFTDFELDPASVTVRVGVYHQGYQLVTIPLRDLDEDCDRAADLLSHAVCLWTTMPGSTAEPMDFGDLDG